MTASFRALACGAALLALDVSADLEVCSGPDLKRLAEAALARARSAEIDAVVVGGAVVAGVAVTTMRPVMNV